MKKLLLSVLAICLFATGFAQKSVINSDEPITWLGLDFSMVKMIGDFTQYQDAGEVTAKQMKERYAPAWNELFAKEQEKYDVAKYTNRTSVKYDMKVTERANNKKFPNAVFTDDLNLIEHLNKEDIDKAVKSYDFGGNKGVGLLFFVESMGKGRKQTNAWVTFVDMGTKTVLQTQRISGKAGGFGMRNFWASSFFNILKAMPKEMK